MKSITKKRLVLVGIRRKGEREFKIRKACTNAHPVKEQLHLDRSCGVSIS